MQQVERRLCRRSGGAVQHVEWRAVQPVAPLGSECVAAQEPAVLQCAARRSTAKRHEIIDLLHVTQVHDTNSKNVCIHMGGVLMTCPINVKSAQYGCFGKATSRYIRHWLGAPP